MARYLSLDEIETMLNQINNNEEIADLKKESPTGRGQEIVFVDKIIRRYTPDVPRYTFEYKSPVIKRKNVVYNSDRPAVHTTSKIPVYSLAGYKQKAN